MSSAARYEVWGVEGIPEVRPGDDLVSLLVGAFTSAPGGTVAAAPLADGDIVVVTSKIVSKAEGRVRTGLDRDAAIDDEMVRTVSEWTTPRGRTRVVETRHGFVMAAAGVDASNVEPGTVVLLPADPDASARRIRAGLRERLGVHVGVILTDTAGRVWRNGVVDMAIGAAGVLAVDDLRGSSDPYGNELGVTVVAVADELASASELVRTKLSAVPVAVVRGLPHLVHAHDSSAPGGSTLDGGTPAGSDADPGASVLVRPSAEDRFRLGTPEAMREAVFNRRTARSFTSDPVDPAALRRALAAALTAPHPYPGHHPPVRFVLVESGATRKALASLLHERPVAVFRSASSTPAVGDVLSSAPCLVVPCLVGTEPSGTAAEPSVWLAAGAAVENLLVTLAADGLGAAWQFPANGNDRNLAAALRLPEGWTPAGVVVIGHPAELGPAHPDLPVDDFTATR